MLFNDAQRKSAGIYTSAPVSGLPASSPQPLSWKSIETYHSSQSVEIIQFYSINPHRFKVNAAYRSDTSNGITDRVRPMTVFCNLKLTIHIIRKKEWSVANRPLFASPSSLSGKTTSTRSCLLQFLRLPFYWLYKFLSLKISADSLKPNSGMTFMTGSHMVNPFNRIDCTFCCVQLTAHLHFDFCAAKRCLSYNQRFSSPCLWFIYAHEFSSLSLHIPIGGMPVYS